MKNFAVAALALGFDLAVTGPAAAQTLKTGYISKDLNYLPFFIAQKKGFHAKEGIAVDLVSIGRSDIQLQAWWRVSSTSPTSTPITSSFGTSARAAT